MAIQRNIVARIGADISSFERELRSAGNIFNNFSRSLNNIGSSLTKAITLPLAGIGAAALKAGMDFEQAMSNIKSLGGATGSQLQKLQDLAIEMGAKTKFSALEAAQGIEELMKAGVKTEQILDGGLQGALNLAAAGNIELSEAAEIASTVLNAFRKDALSVAKAADILAGAANASATDVLQLKLGLSMVSAVASGVGMSFKDTATALAVFAQNGLQSSDAGTSLKTMLLNLQPATDKATEIFQKFGLINKKGKNIFFTTEGKLKSLADIAGVLRKQLGSLNDAQRQQTLQMMFGTDAIRAANILYNEGTDGVTNMQTAMSQVTAQEVATEKNNNLKGSLDQLKGSLETIAVTLYMTNSGPLKAFVDKLTELANSFINLKPETQQQIILFAGVAAAIGPLLMIAGQLFGAIGTIVGVFQALAGVLGPIITAVGELIGGTGTLGAVVAALGGPVTIIIGAIAALTAAFVYFYTTNETFRDTVKNILNGIATVSLYLWQNVLTPFGQFLKGVFVASWDAVTKAATWLYINVLTPFAQFLGSFQKSVLVPLASIISEVLVIAFNSLSVVAKSLWLNVLVPLYNYFKDLLKPGIEALSAVFNALWQNVLKPIGEFIVKVFEPAWASLGASMKKYWDTILKPLANFFSTVFVAALDDTFKRFKIIIEGLKGILTGILNFITGAFTWDWGKAWEGIKKVFESIVGTFAGIFKIPINHIISLINMMIDKVNSVKINIPSVDIPGVGALGGGTIGFDIPKIPALATGTNNVPDDMLAYLHEGEAVVPKKYNNNMQNGTIVNNFIVDGQILKTYINDGLGKSLTGLGALK